MEGTLPLEDASELIQSSLAPAESEATVRRRESVCYSPSDHERRNPVMSNLKETGRAVARILTSIGVVRRSLRAVARAGVLPRSMWTRLPVATTFRVPTSEGRSFAYASVMSDNIGRALFWRDLRDWEPETVSVFVTLARRARWFLDVGANTGAYTLIALAENSALHAVSFEPVPHIFDRMRENLTINGFGSRCSARREAVSDFEGHARLHVPDTVLPTSASLDERGFRGTTGTLVDVPVTTIDAACAGRDDIDLAKIDVEGFEDKALAGMGSVLSQCAPAIVVECNPDGPFRGVEAALRVHRYRFFHLRDRGAVARDGIEPDPDEVFRNYLCLPESKLDWVPGLVTAGG